MKKIAIITGILFAFCILIAGISIKCNGGEGEDLQGIFKINGWIAYAVKTDKNKNFLWGRLDADLIQDSGYSIAEVKLNNAKFNFHHDHETYDYEIYLKPFELAVGDTLELALGIRKKGEAPVPESIKYHIIASFKVNNLYEQVIFPEPNRMLKLDQGTDPNLKFKWTFSDFIQPSIVNIMEGDKNVIVKEVNEDYIILDKKIFKYDSQYDMEIGALHGPDHHFPFTRVVEAESELTFTHTYTVKFETVKKPTETPLSEP